MTTDRRDTATSWQALTAAYTAITVTMGILTVYNCVEVTTAAVHRSATHGPAILSAASILIYFAFFAMSVVWAERTRRVIRSAGSDPAAIMVSPFNSNHASVWVIVGITYFLTSFYVIRHAVDGGAAIIFGTVVLYVVQFAAIVILLRAVRTIGRRVKPLIPRLPSAPRPAKTKASKQELADLSWLAPRSDETASDETGSKDTRSNPASDNA